MKTTKQVLIEARAVIEDPTHWTKGLLARRADTVAVPPNHAEAVCWCSMGAVQKALGPRDAAYFDAEEAAMNALDHAGYVLYSIESVVSVNDMKTHADVLAVFDKAIELQP